MFVGHIPKVVDVLHSWDLACLGLAGCVFEACALMAAWFKAAEALRVSPVPVIQIAESGVCAGSLL